MKYNRIEEKTPQEYSCFCGSCSAVFSTKIEGAEVYLIVGRRIDPSEAGLAQRVGVGEVLVEVPKGLIDKMKRD